MKTTGNTILMTGGGSGIGRALAEAFHALGNRVIIAGRGLAKLQNVVAANPGMEALTVDMGDPESIRTFATESIKRWPGINVLINMAGVMMNEDLTHPETALADSEATVATNLLGPIRLTAALMPALLKQPNAVIMNVSSGLAFVPMALTPTYCATKSAIHSYTQSLRYQLRESSVQVLELIPPYVQTELQGEHQKNDPMAMPLDAYIAETMRILSETPEAVEICVERVMPLRTAEKSGAYDAFFTRFNDQVMAAASGR